MNNRFYKNKRKYSFDEKCEHYNNVLTKATSRPYMNKTDIVKADYSLGFLVGAVQDSLPSFSQQSKACKLGFLSGVKSRVKESKK